MVGMCFKKAFISCLSVICIRSDDHAMSCNVHLYKHDTHVFNGRSNRPTPCHIVPSSHLRIWWHPWYHFSMLLVLWSPVIIKSHLCLYNHIVLGLPRLTFPLIHRASHQSPFCLPVLPWALCQKLPLSTVSPMSKIAFVDNLYSIVHSGLIQYTQVPNAYTPNNLQSFAWYSCFRYYITIWYPVSTYNAIIALLLHSTASVMFSNLLPSRHFIHRQDTHSP